MGEEGMEEESELYLETMLGKHGELEGEISKL